MLQNLEKVIGNDAVTMIHLVNEKNNLLPNSNFKNLSFIIVNLVEVCLLILVLFNKLPEYIFTIIICIAWVYYILDYLFYRKINRYIDKVDGISRRLRILAYTKYETLIRIFEKSIYVKIDFIFHILFILIVIISDRYIQGVVFLLIWAYTLKLQDELKDILINYFEYYIKEDWRTHGTS